MPGDTYYRKYSGFNANFVTWVRNPYELIPSTYYYLKKNFPSHNRLPSKDCSLLDFIKFKKNQNILNFYTGGDLDKYKFVGVVENYDESLHKMCDIFCLEMPGKNLRVNVNSEKKSDKYKLRKEEMMEIRRHNEADIQLYLKAINEWV